MTDATPGAGESPREIVDELEERAEADQDSGEAAAARHEDASEGAGGEPTGDATPDVPGSGEPPD